MNRTVKIVATLLIAAFAAPAAAQQYPAKPIKIVIPFVAGGSSDIVGRAIGSKFQEYLGQPAVVENRPGANGAIAAEFVAKADPDGYEEFGDFMKAEVARWTQVVKRGGIQPE